MISYIALAASMTAAQPAVDAAQHAQAPVVLAQADMGSANVPPVAQPQTPAPGDGEIVVTGRFIDTGAQSATKLDVRALDVPLSVSAYSEKFLQAIEANRVSDLYKYMTGVQRAGRSGVSIVLRGFGSSNNDRNAIMTDGLPGLSGRQSPSTATSDHIEVVKGPASILYGQVQPGGFVNIITKKPSLSAATTVDLRFEKGVGEFDRAITATGTVDTTGPLTGSGDILYRFVGETGFGNGFRKRGYETPLLLAPSLSFEFGDTSITLLGEYQRVKEFYDSFLVAYDDNIANVARLDTSYQEPWDYELNEGGSGTILVTQKLSSAFKAEWRVPLCDRRQQDQRVRAARI